MDTPRPDTFTGEVNEHLAHIYVRLSGSGKIRGRVRGPFNMHSQTLPCNYPLLDLGPGPSRLARATVTDPCTWSPESPSLYEVIVESSEGTASPVSFGIRRFGVVGKNLFLNGKRWVMRGIFAEHHGVDPGCWREVGATRVMEVAEATELHAATRQGVMTLLNLDKAAAAELHLAARFASAAIVVIPVEAEISNELRKEVPNLILGQRVQSPADLGSWAEVAWVEFHETVDFQRRIAGLTCPVIAVRRGQFPTLEVARAAIDALQAELAPIGQFAGYVV